MTLRIGFQMLWGAVFGGPRAAAGVVLGNQKLTQDVAALLAEGAIWPVIGARFPLERVADAHEELESGNPLGAVVVCVAGGAREIGQDDAWAAE
jgi:D-arabinose 1-dehydrogenase-like Zn-dependent alcohol dehydrogenase